MYSLDILHISWLNFMVTAIVISLFWMGGYIIFTLLKKKYSHTAKILSINYLIILERVYRILLVAILFISFVLINPLIHGILVLLFLATCYTLLKDIFIGLTVIHKLNLLVDNQMIVAEHSGTIKALKWLGMILEDGHTTRYIPYSKLHEQGFRQSELSYSQHLKFRILGDGFNKQQIEEAVLEKLLMIPFLNQDTKPDIEFHDDLLYLKAELTDLDYHESLINAIEEVKLENITLKTI